MPGPACSWPARCWIGRPPPAATCCRPASPPASRRPRACCAGSTLADGRSLPRALGSDLDRPGIDRHAAHVAALAGVVVEREVPDRTVVPEGHRAGLPREPRGERLIARVLEKIIQ